MMLRSSVSLVSHHHLKRIDVAQTILHPRIHHQLGQSEDLSGKMKGIAEPTLFALYRWSYVRVSWGWSCVDVRLRLDAVGLRLSSVC